MQRGTTWNWRAIIPKLAWILVHGWQQNVYFEIKCHQTGEVVSRFSGLSLIFITPGNSLQTGMAILSNWWKSLIQLVKSGQPMAREGKNGGTAFFTLCVWSVYGNINIISFLNVLHFFFSVSDSISSLLWGSSSWLRSATPFAPEHNLSLYWGCRL